jgi:hypothetical protein
MPTRKGSEPVGTEFEADHPPKKVFEPVFKQHIEKFLITCGREARLLPDAKLSDASVKLLLDYQVCNEQRCLPLKEAFEVSLATGAASPFDAQSDIFKSRSSEKSSVKPVPVKRAFTHVERPLIQSKPGPAEISARLEPENAKPGDGPSSSASSSTPSGTPTGHTGPGTGGGPDFDQSLPVRTV